MPFLRPGRAREIAESLSLMGESFHFTINIQTSMEETAAQALRDYYCNFIVSRVLYALFKATWPNFAPGLPLPD